MSKGRPKGTRRGMTKRDLVKEISDKTEIRADIVMSILNCLVDIIIREIVLNESFTALSSIFNVKSHKRKARKTIDLKTKEEVTYPATRVLSVNLSPKINYFFRWKLRNERNMKNGTSRENWKDFYDENKDIDN